MQFEEKPYFSIDPEHVSRIRLTVGILCILLAISNYFGDPSSLSTGRWSWVYRSIASVFGHYGYLIFEAAVGLFFIAWSRRKSSDN
jgi:hypothetical protein